MPSPTNNDNEKYTKLWRFIGLGVLAALGVVGWHCYDFLMRKNGGEADQAENEHEIVDLTRKLFADELKHNPYLTQVNFQGRTKPYGRDDRAPQPLLQINHELLQTDTISTVALMRRLFDNYELETHIVEHVTPQEETEELDFLHAVMKTPIMKRTMQFLHKKGAVAADNKAQLQLLKDIWFTQYSRGHGLVGSSGFEHVFLAELREQTILGLHNWIYFSDQEEKGNLDYKGFIDRIDLGKDDQHLLAARFTFHGIAKPYNTLFIGTSPELEMSMYTVCFLLSGTQPCPVQLGATRFTIITHAWDWKGKKMIASAYPSIEK